MAVALPFSTLKLKIFYAVLDGPLELPLVSTAIAAGFPSPAGDFMELSIDLNRDFIKHPSATFYGKVSGTSMINAGINDGDLLIIDRSIKPQDGKIAVCYVDGEFTVKRIKIEKDCCWLIAENDDYEPIKVDKDNEFQIWGIVVHTIKTF